MESTQRVWKNCSTCKKPISVGAKYFICSVSSCQGQRTGYQFCSMTCFEAHLPGARHRDAGAIEKIAPKVIIASTPSATAGAAVASSASQSASSSSSSAVNTQEVLIIASRLKDYIAAKSDFNTSASVMDCLSKFVRLASDRAIENARADGRRTVMDRDFDFLLRG